MIWGEVANPFTGAYEIDRAWDRQGSLPAEGDQVGRGYHYLGAQVEPPSSQINRMADTDPPGKIHD